LCPIRVVGEAVARVIVCEPDEATLDLICDRLAANRFESFPAADAKEALPLCQRPAWSSTGTASRPWVSFHRFRHTCASLLFENGRNVKQVSEWLGHADPSFTLSTYAHLVDEGTATLSSSTSV
jgi:integrase